jgi:hypothetical protein
VAERKPPPSDPQPASPPSDRPKLWDEELDQAIARHWITHQLKATSTLAVDATVEHPRKPRQRGTGAAPGHPRAAPELNDQLIAEARADWLERGPKINRYGDLKRAVAYVFDFLARRGVIINEQHQHKTVARRVIKGEDYKHASDKPQQQTKP